MRLETKSIRFLTLSEAAIFLRVTKSTIYAWVHQRRLPFRKHGRLLVFSIDELLAWSESQKFSNELKDCILYATPSVRTGSAQIEQSSLKVEQNENAEPFKPKRFRNGK